MNRTNAGSNLQSPESRRINTSNTALILALCMLIPIAGLSSLFAVDKSDIEKSTKSCRDECKVKY